MLRKICGDFFSLTGAGFSYSSYQHPRRDLGINTNRFSILYNIPLAGEFVFTICRLLLFNVCLIVFSSTKVYDFKNIEQKKMLSYDKRKIIISPQISPMLLQSYGHCLILVLYSGHQAFQYSSYNL